MDAIAVAYLDHHLGRVRNADEMVAQLTGINGVERFAAYARRQGVEEARMSRLQQQYQHLFQSILQDFDATSPAQLDERGRREFFNTVKRSWIRGVGPKRSREGASLEQLVVEELTPSTETAAKSTLTVEDLSFGEAKALLASIGLELKPNRRQDSILNRGVKCGILYFTSAAHKEVDKTLVRMTIDTRGLSAQQVYSLSKAETATVEKAGWFEDMSPAQQRAYIKSHPNSKYAKSAKAKRVTTKRNIKSRPKPESKQIADLRSMGAVGKPGEMTIPNGKREALHKKLLSDGWTHEETYAREEGWINTTQEYKHPDGRRIDMWDGFVIDGKQSHGIYLHNWRV